MSWSAKCFLLDSKRTHWDKATPHSHSLWAYQLTADNAKGKFRRARARRSSDGCPESSSLAPLQLQLKLKFCTILYCFPFILFYKNTQDLLNWIKSEVCPVQYPAWPKRLQKWSPTLPNCALVTSPITLLNWYKNVSRLCQNLELEWAG